MSCAASLGLCGSVTMLVGRKASGDCKKDLRTGAVWVASGPACWGCSELYLGQVAIVVERRACACAQVKFCKSGSVCICRITTERPIAIETFADVPQLGRFTLRDEGRTIAIGKVMRLPKAGAKA